MCQKNETAASVCDRSCGIGRIQQLFLVGRFLACLLIVILNGGVDGISGQV